MHTIADIRKAVMEGEAVEEDETSDAQGGGAVFLVIGLGNDFGDAASRPGVLLQLLRGLFNSVSDDPGGGGDAVRPLKLQREDAEIVCEVGSRPVSDGAIGPYFAMRAVEPPIEKPVVFETGADIDSVFERERIEDANHGQGIGELFQPLIKLAFQCTGGIFPLALYYDQIALAQLDLNIGYTLSPAALGVGFYAIIAKHLHKQGVDRFFADGFRIVQLGCHVVMRRVFEDAKP